MTAALSAMALALLVASVKKGTDYVKYIKSGDWNGTLTQTIAWALGIGAAFLFAASDFGTKPVQGIIFSDLNPWSLIILGLSLGSGGSILKDFISGIDNTQSAVVPPLLPPSD